jgi:uncharacterized protein YndB with AHSA1/START domain
MNARNFTVSVHVDASPERAFAAIVDPRAWWGKTIDGDTTSLGAEWSYRYKDMHFSRHRTIELIPGQRVAWQVVDADMSFLADRAEWKDTTIVFDLLATGGGTEIVFTHVGLEPAVECFDVCSDAWTGLITGSLREFIETGAGNPDSVEKAAV